MDAEHEAVRTGNTGRYEGDPVPRFNVFVQIVDQVIDKNPLDPIQGEAEVQGNIFGPATLGGERYLRVWLETALFSDGVQTPEHPDGIGCLLSHENPFHSVITQTGIF